MNRSVPISPGRKGVAAGFLVVAIATVLFDRLFWQQGMGVNVLLFIILVVAAHLVRSDISVLSPSARWLGFGSVLAACMVVVHDSVVATIAAWSSICLFAAMAQRAALRSLVGGALEWSLNLLRVPLSAIVAVNAVLENRPMAARGWKWLRLSILPLFALVLYLSIYRAADPRFDALTSGVVDRIAIWLHQLFSEVLTAHALFLLFAVVLCTALLRRMTTGSIARWEAGRSEILVRVRKRRPHWLAPGSLDPLEKERQRGILLLAVMNGLLLVVNVIDIDWLWFDFTVPVGFDLKQFVHEGTWLLILSILLSMGILFHLFRGNLNFHPRAGMLRVLALAWVMQNFVLGVSVFLRNYHYIDFHGLAYKRIGVIVFLALVLVGLIALFRKIQMRRSMFHVLRVNAWAAYVMLLFLALFDWDSLIVRYNLQHWNQGQIDVDNYLEMSDKVIPLLYADLPKVDAQMAKHRMNPVRWVEHLDPQGFLRDLERKRRRFIERHTEQGWPSWSWAEARTFAQLQKMGLADAK
ncbi:MAG: DUF4173 domain-containing protein [Flavobacteriales bacterium]|nr:DUF4173 domain-containing protein [Flavobacteriales bacterium]